MRKRTDEEIYDELKQMIKCTKQTYFPTHSEIKNFYGNNALCVQISRRGGSREWAKRLGMCVKNSESEFGNNYELIAIQDIKEHTGFDSRQTKPRYPYDLYTNELVKVDVKAAMPIKDLNFEAWSFNLEKKEPTCDIFIFYCINVDGNIIKKAIIPACVLSGQTQVGIGSLSKYDNYIDRWDLIVEYNDFLRDVKEKIAYIPKRRTKKIV